MPRLKFVKMSDRDKVLNLLWSEGYESSFIVGDKPGTCDGYTRLIRSQNFYFVEWRKKRKTP